MRADRPFSAGLLGRIRANRPLVHCITNYVTANDCANALLACGASPVMCDEPDEVAEMTSAADALVLNIGTLNMRTIRAMHLAGERAAARGIPIVLDPVGAGATALRTETAVRLVQELPLALIRGNMSEMRALAHALGIDAGRAAASPAARGVDAAPCDAVSDGGLPQAAAFARELAGRTCSVVAITGAIDVVADASHALAVRNGCALMGEITGSGCMLGGISAAFAAVGADDVLGAAAAAVAYEGIAGQMAEENLAPGEGCGSFRVRLMDAFGALDDSALAARARVEAL